MCSDVNICAKKGTDGLCEASNLYDNRNGKIFVLSLARVYICALVSDPSDVLIEGDAACISMFIFLVLRYVVTMVVRCIFCLMSRS